MRFGDLPLAEAEGAILAHRLRLPAGGVFKKGRVLSADDVAALRASGRESVVAAKLEPGDVHEDAAAAALADAIAGPGLSSGEPFTGRCNLHAQARGLLVVERERIDRINAIDEAITVATLAPYAPVEPRELAATVKIIPFAVPAGVLAACVEAARGESPCARVAPFRSGSAGLIVTQTPELAASVIERAVESQRTRVGRLAGRVREEIRCPHDEQSVARAIRSLLASGCDPILMLGASAIVDRRDVLPSAVLRAGGAIEQLGMPVDPGNLLLLARHGATTLIGLPGCARSLKPSGADFVLERTLAGLPVSAGDLRRMGVGGLLKEAPRPQPRERAEDSGRDEAPRVSAIVLAAGLSRRMGERNKLLAEVDGAPMLARVVDALLASSVADIVVVTGHEAERVRGALGNRELRFAHNPDFAEGLASSVRTGIAAIAEKADAALICLGDMPWVRAEHIDALLAASDPAGGGAICVPSFDRKRGNPVLWPARYFPELSALRGDAGARALLDAHTEQVRLVPIADAAVTLDVDTPEALAAVRRETRRSP